MVSGRKCIEPELNRWTGKPAGRTGFFIYFFIFNLLIICIIFTIPSDSCVQSD
ncbi:hypothetical protein Hanom_Chr03g00249081 [Helianthus anomalus]